MSRPPLPVLTTLRFFAALEVVFYHVPNLRFRPTSIAGDIVVGLMSGGYRAVTFFFILSGFILVYVYADAKEHLQINVGTAEFWRARIARIVPAYILALVIMLPNFVYAAFVVKTISVQLFIVGGVLVLTFLQAWWPPASMLWNLPAWSLSVEALFYFLFPLLIRATRLARPNCILLGAYGLVALSVGTRLLLTPAAGAWPDEDWQKFVGYFPLFHLPNFMFGMALGYWYLRAPPMPSRQHVGLFAAGTAGVIVFFGAASILPWWLDNDLILVILFGAVILGGAQAQSPLTVLTAPIPVLLGELSYAIYILHVPVWFWWNWLAHKQLGLNLPVAFDFALYFAAVIAASHLTFRYLERPLRRHILGRREHKDA